MSNYTENHMRNDIKHLQNQNSYDYQEIKRLGEIIEKLKSDIKSRDKINSLLIEKLTKDYEKFKDLIVNDNAILELIENKISIVARNSRKYRKVFGHCIDWSFQGGNGGNWARERIINDIDDLKSKGIESISVTLQTKFVDGVLRLVSDLDLFNDCIDYARTVGIEVNFVKIHCNEFRKAIKNDDNKEPYFTQWYSLVETVSDYFRGKVQYLIPMNEGEHIFTQAVYEDFLLNCLDICQSKGFLSGYNPSSHTQWDSLPESVKNKCDIITFNCYPNISLKGLNTTYEDVIKGFEEYGINTWIETHYKKYNKEVIICEIGVDDRPLSFANTYVWDFGYSEPYQNGKVQAIMLKGIFEYFKDNPYLKLWYFWFTFRGEEVIPVIQEYIGGV